VAAKNRLELRHISDQFRPLLAEQGCYKTSPYFLDTVHLLENVLFRAGYVVHPVADKELSETAAFTIPERGLIVLRESLYHSLFENDAFARYTVVHEFSHIALAHAVSLHRGAVLGQHAWYEDSEWQANNLTAEIMMPVSVVRALDCKPLLISAECGVSSRAVQFRLDNLRKEKLI
jgi:hypothetical protein